MATIATPEEDQPTLQLGTGSDIDPNQAFQHIGRTVQMRIGVTNRAYGRDYIQFDVHCAPMRVRRVLVQLGGDDLYHLEIGRLNRRNFEWVSEYVQREIGVEQLAAEVEAGYVAVYER